MKAWCAWCQEEGKPGFLGERPPLDDPSDTHGICDHHRTMLLAALPQRPATAPARPVRRMLLILDPDSVELYRYLTRSFARSEEHTSELQSRGHLVCRLLLEKKKQTAKHYSTA